MIPHAQIQQTNAWTPESGEPPLSFTKAYSLAKSWAKEHYSRYDDARIKEIALKQYGCSTVKDRWYYEISITPMIDGNELWGGGNWAAILMDGTVIGAEKL